MSFVAVLSNTALICFTGELLSDFGMAQRAFLFIIVEHGLLGIKFFFALIVEDVSEEVTMQRERKDFLVSKVYNKQSFIYLFYSYIL